MNMVVIGNVYNVIKYCEKLKYLKYQELCLRYLNSVYDNFCEFCNILICFDCIGYRIYKKIDVGIVYEIKCC